MADTSIVMRRIYQSEGKPDERTKIVDIGLIDSVAFGLKQNHSNREIGDTRSYLFEQGVIQIRGSNFGTNRQALALYSVFEEGLDKLASEIGLS